MASDAPADAPAKIEAGAVPPVLARALAAERDVMISSTADDCDIVVSRGGSTYSLGRCQPMLSARSNSVGSISTSASSDVRQLGMESFCVESGVSSVRGVVVPSYRLFAAVLICCVSPLLLGFSLGFTSPVQASMEGLAKGTAPEVLPPSSLTVFTPHDFTMYAAVLNVGAIPGAFAGSAAADRYGRRRALALSAVPYVIAWSATMASSSALLLQLLRMLIGFAAGMGSAITPLYISEIAPSHLRGPLGTAIQLAMNFGLLFVNVAGVHAPVAEVHGGQSFSNWRRLSSLGVALAAVLTAMLLMPESPKWLAQKGDRIAARVALRQLRSGDTALEEAELLAAEEGEIADKAPRTPSTMCSTPTPAASSGPRSTRLRDYRLSMTVAVGLLAFQQLSGINAITMYMSGICTQACEEHAETSTMVVMVAQVALTGLACVLVEAAGRRSLLQTAGLLMCMSHVGLAYYMAAQERGWWAPPWLALGALGTYIIGYAIGMGPVPTLILGEVFPVEVAGSASALAMAVSWLCAFVVSMAFRALQSVLGASGVFGLFGLFCFGCLVFVSALLPETKGQGIDDTLHALRGRARTLSLVGARLIREEDAQACVDPFHLRV